MYQPMSYGQPSNESMPMQHCQWDMQMPASSATTLQESPMNDEGDSLSAYARWKLEEDERFYATFPEARCAAQQYNTISNAYLVGTGYYYDADGRLARSNEAAHYPLSLYSDYSVATSPESHQESYDHHYGINYKESLLTQALVPTSRDELARSGASSSSHYNLASPSPLTTVEIIQTDVIIPSQQPPSPPESPFMDSLPSPTASSSSYNSTRNSKPSILPKKLDGISHPSMAYADPSRHHMYSYTSSYNLYSSTSQVPPTGWPIVCTPSPRSIRLSPLPSSRRLIAKKPPLACLFCRGRKIACGPPDPGSSDRSCNQCQRRSIKCEYPAGSRRGMRKKKKGSIANINDSGPKVRVGRRSRVLL